MEIRTHSNVPKTLTSITIITITHPPIKYPVYRPVYLSLLLNSEAVNSKLTCNLVESSSAVS